MVSGRAGSPDNFDLKLLELLQRDGDLTRSELAKTVHLSPSQCSRRVQRLKEAGVIRRVVAQLDHRALGFTVAAHVAIALSSRGDAFIKPFRERLVASPHVFECVAVTGEYDLMLKIVVREMTDLQAVLAELREDEAVASMRSSIVLEEIKGGGELRLR